METQHTALTSDAAMSNRSVTGEQAPPQHDSTKPASTSLNQLSDSVGSCDLEKMRYHQPYHQVFEFPVKLLELAGKFLRRNIQTGHGFNWDMCVQSFK